MTKAMFPFIELTTEYSSDSLNRDVLKWIVQRNHSFSLIDEPEFRSIIESLNPGLKLLHRTALTKKYLPILETELQEKVILLK